MNLPDAYVLRARVAPVIIITLPFIVALFTSLTTGTEWLTIATAGGVGLAILTFVAQLGRERGKKIEALLFEEWGGAPTTVMLRHRDSQMDVTTKERLHSRLCAKVENLVLPNAEEERIDHKKADKLYESAVYWLRSNTKDNGEFNRLHEENISYGFRRNLLGLKPLGLGLAIFFIGLNFWIYRPATMEQASIYITQSSILAAIALTGFLVFLVRKSWVKSAADSYAFALFNAMDSIE